MIMADQDHDGSHIKGLLMNLFHAEWPGLMLTGFLCTLLTPILKASKGKSVLSFYSIPEFMQWKDSQGFTDTMGGWKLKYYKGLGTSTPAEAREWFRDLHEIKYEWDEKTDESMNLAFNKKQADDRKKWLSHYDPTLMLLPVENKVSYTSFVNSELIHFSNADNIRSLPHLMDGLKPSQRKILYSCFKRNLKEEIRVAQLAGYVSEHAAYHHGEASLNSTIVGMAQNFVGSNNINLLKPMGQFGCLAPDTPILMWNGTTKHAEHVVVGDELVGDDGKKRIVSKTTSGTDDMYDVIDEKGTSYTVNSQHILTLQFVANFQIKWKESSSLWYFIYFNGSSIAQVAITANDHQKINDHLNRSTVTKEEAYRMICIKRDELQQKYSSSPIIDIKISDYLQLSSYAKRGLYSISNTECIHWEKKAVPLDPYLLGAWLGDGDHAGKGFTTCDEEIIQSFVIGLKEIGAEVTHHISKNHDGYHYSIRRRNTGHLPAIGSILSSKEKCVGCTSSNVLITHNACNWKCDDAPTEMDRLFYETCTQHRRNPFTQRLRDNNLYKNKHIPIDYMINDKETRLQLLAGLIDTDGTIKENHTDICFIEISQSKRLHENLIHSADFIAKSLGYATSIYTYGQNNVTKKGEDMTILTLRIMGNHLDEIPTRIPRKKVTFTTKRITKTIHYTKFTIRPIGKGPFNGWSIDGNERFLLGNFIVTHNSRLMGGKDSASPRYIHTYLEDIVKTIFRKEDAGLLKHIQDDGDTVEPEYYLPVVPMITLNGIIGIGTGYSTDIPPYKPDDIVCLLKHRLQGTMESLAGRPLDPWWFGFKGVTLRADDNTWLTKGLYTTDDDKKTVTITELPVGTWTKDYKAFLDALCEADEKKSKEAKKEAKKSETESNKSSKDDGEPCGLKGFDDLYNDQDVRFILYFTEEGYDAVKENADKFEKQFKLLTSWKTTNMTCFDTDFNIVKYKTLGDILEAFMEKRLPMYEARRVMLLAVLQKQIDELDAKRRFIQAILDDRLVLQKKTDEEIVAGLQANQIPPLSNPGAPDTYDSYDYVLRMRMDRVKAAAVLELDGQITEKRGEIEHLEAETASSLWLADLEEFHQAWIHYSEVRIFESVSVTSSDEVGKKKRKPTIAKVANAKK